jgi:tetratricopeptide (TPR) repeat protein
MGSGESKAEKLHAQGCYGGNDFLKDGKLGKIQLAVRLLSEAVDEAPLDHPKRALLLRDRGSWGGYLYERSGKAQDFTESVNACEEAISLATPEHADRPITLITYGDLLMKQYRREKVDANLERAEKLYEEAVHLTPPGHEYRMASMLSLGDCLIPKFEKTKDIQDIDKAIKCCKDGIAATKPPDLPVWGYSALSACYQAKYEVTKARSDIDEAANAARKSEQLCPEHPYGLTALVKCCSTSYKQTQSLKEINSAIAYGQKALKAAGGLNQLQWEENICILGDQYDAKYAKTLNEEDLDNCIYCRREQSKVLCDADPARAHCLYLLCGFLFKKYQATDKHQAAEAVKVLLEAISAGEKGVSAQWLVPNDSERVALLDLLSSCYNAKLARKDLGKAKDLQKAISFGEEALQRMAQDDPRRAEIERKVNALRVDGFYKEPNK